MCIRDSVIATSEPADSQVSSFSPARTTSLSSYDEISSLVASQSVTSLRPLNRQIVRSHLLVQQGLFSQMAAIQLESKNSEDRTSWKCNRGVKTKLLLLIPEKKRGLHECTDYKLQWCFIRLDSSFKSGQPHLPLFSSPDKRLRLQLSLIKARRLG